MSSDKKKTSKENIPKLKIPAIEAAYRYEGQL